MMFRKGTRIELKYEEDSQEYDETKRRASRNEQQQGHHSALTTPFAPFVRRNKETGLSDSVQSAGEARIRLDNYLHDIDSLVQGHIGAEPSRGTAGGSLNPGRNLMGSGSGADGVPNQSEILQFLVNNLVSTSSSAQGNNTGHPGDHLFPH